MRHRFAAGLFPLCMERLHESCMKTVSKLHGLRGAAAAGRYQSSGP